MTSRQFQFSVTVGVLLTVLGLVIMSQAAVGISLAGLGLAITILSVVNHRVGRKQKAELYNTSQAA